MSSEKVKLISLNIERDLHYATVLPFLKREQADVVCLMEILDRDLPRLEEELGMRGFYAPIARADRGRGTELLAHAGVNSGTGLFSRLPLAESGAFYYFGSAGTVPSKRDPVPPGRHENISGVFISARLRKAGQSFTIGTTHFTWTPDGSVSDGQRQDMKILLKKLREFPDIVLCGDFNAPRGGAIWRMLASRYTDNIPQQYTTSIDQNLHLVKGIMHVVDGLFSTPEYRCTNTRLESGVSDHCAIVSTIERIG